MSTDLIPFSFDSIPVRTFLDDTGEPWFCAKDVCDVLGYANSRKSIADHCRAKGVTNRDTLTDGGIQPLSFINEGNLYRLIIKSRKPEAERFESWVCDEVLPTIRKTGQYVAPRFRPERTRKALPGGLTVEQQDAVKALVKSRVEALPHDDQARGAITCWSAIKSKFGVTYKEVPAASFAEVLSLVARLPLQGEPKALPPIHFPAVTAMPKWDPNHMNSYGQLHLSAKNTFFNPDWADPEWLLLSLLQSLGFEVMGAIISYQLKMHLIRFYELELPGFLVEIIPGLMRNKGLFWDEAWAPRPAR